MKVYTDALVVRFKRLHELVTMPEYKTKGAAGIDLIITEDTPWLKPGDITIADSGLAVEIPEGWYGLVTSRSGIATRRGIVVLNSPGVIDSDYRGEVRIPIINLSHQDQKIMAGTRVAQMIFQPAPQALLLDVETLEETERGEKGFGSTGAQ